MEAKIVLHTNNVIHRFGGLVAVNDVSINLKKREILGLIGPNGAGKTTLFNIISGAIKPTSGDVYYNGEKITGKSPYKICRAGIGRTFQVVKPFSNLTVLDNAMVGSLNRTSNMQIAKEKAEEALMKVNMIDLRSTKGSDLNLPQLKRLEIARAIATEPEILLLDEVMAGLTPAECEKAMEVVMKLRTEGMTILVIEHVMKAIMNISDRIYVLDQGALIAEGSPQEIAINEKVIASYLGGKKNAKG